MGGEDGGDGDEMVVGDGSGVRWLRLRRRKS